MPRYRRQFDTVLGPIGFDAESDVIGCQQWQRHVWQAEGTMCRWVRRDQETVSGAHREPNFADCGRSNAGAG